MKLRNKKTGEAVYVDFQIPLCNNDETLGSYSVTSLEALNRSFEDYKPTEPLIKDEKIRKAVRAWASTFGDIRKIAVKYDAARVSFHFGAVDSSIEFGDDVDIDCEDRQLYTIDELCGEEEE